jgi:F0F1-type ATP synthase delta subunit
MDKKIFITVVGQFTNVGDVMHRREIISWLKETGELHAYVGAAPKSFIEGLQLPDSAHLYTNLYKWLWSICWSKSKKTIFVFNPGQMRLGTKRLIGELFLLPIELLVRLKKGPILRLGVAVKSGSSTSFKWLWNSFFSLTTHLYWRTSESREQFQRGFVIPDLAFNEVKINSSPKPNAAPSRFLTVSMRSDRPPLTEDSLDAIKQVADESNLEIRVVAQVRMDNEMTEYLSKKLDSDAVIWPNNVSHIEQESKLRHIYRKSELVLSDRLHVLIAASTEGAIPATLLPAKIKKVEEHFSVINISDIAYEVSDKSKEEIASFLKSLFDRKVEIGNAIKNAQKKLNELRKKITQDISSIN